MQSRRMFRSIAWLLVAGLGVTLASTAVASDEGLAAADQVSEASYRYFLGDNEGVEGILYTHAGDARGVGDPQHDLARDNIAAHFEDYGLTVTLEPVYYSGTWYNVVGTKLGTVYPDQEYIIGAHYDSVSNPGADDNASGVSLVLECARILTQYDSDYTIRFVAFTREEQGLYGAYAYVDAHSTDDILGMISADMVAYNSGADSADIYAQTASAPIRDALAAAVAEYGDGLSYSFPGSSGASNHAPFEYAGFQACLLIEDWGNPYYHTSQDNVDVPGYIDYAFAVKMTRSVVGYLVDNAGVHVPVDSVRFSFPDGQPEFVAPAGGTTMRVEVTGVGAAVPEPGTGMFHYDAGGGWESVPMDVVSDNVYDAAFPAVDCEQEILYYVSAEDTGGTTYTDPRSAPIGSYSAISAYGEAVLLEDDFESDTGWTVEAGADTGNWERADPQEVSSSGTITQPADDHSPDGTLCFVTDGRAGSSVGDYDVDGGPSRLISPVIDLEGRDALVSYWRWYHISSELNDELVVDVSNDDGANWVTVETVDHRVTWTYVQWRVSDYLTPSSQVRVRFTVDDSPNDSLVEALIDDFVVSELICDPECPGDLDGDGDTDLGDLAALLAAYDTTTGDPGYDPAADFDDDGDVDLADLAFLLADYGCGE